MIRDTSSSVLERDFAGPDTCLRAAPASAADGSQAAANADAGIGAQLTVQGAQVGLWACGLGGPGVVYLDPADAQKVRICVEDSAFLRVLASSPAVGIAPPQRATGRRGRWIPPVWCERLSVGERGLLVQCPRAPESPLLYPLSSQPSAIVRSLASGRPLLRASIAALGPFEGALVLHERDPGVHVGGVFVLTAYPSPGQALMLRVQIIGRSADGFTWFRVVDREGMLRCAHLLLLCSPTFTSSHLERLGLPAQSAARFLDVRAATDDRSFLDALEVRLLANQRFGRLRGIRDPAAVLDDLDRHAVNLVCRLGSKPVGAGRVVINAGDRSRSECEREVGLPEWLWRGGFVEVSRFAAHPHYRGAGVAVELFRAVHRIAYGLGCRYVVLDSIGKLLPMYHRIGAKPLGLSKQHPYSSERVHLLCIDTLDLLSSIRKNFLSWLFIFGPVVQEAAKQGELHTYERQMGPLARVSYALKLGACRIMGALRGAGHG